MGKKRKQLSQAEVWDDSALVQSWNDALEEYKLYHSIHVRGDRVEDVLREVEVEDEETTDENGHNILETTTEAQSNQILRDDLEDGELDDGEAGGVEAARREKVLELSNPTIEKLQPVVHPEQPNPPESSTAGQLHGISSVPSTILAGVQDDALKNLMMSWYYAGYYTGLYEGQKQAAATVD